MDRKFYMDSFERLLKEKSDEFRMYPTRNVWHSIYNNIYPGRKWPSAIISILLITTLPLIGFLNTKKQQATIESKPVATISILSNQSSTPKIIASQVILVSRNEIIGKPVLSKSFAGVNNKKQSNSIIQQFSVKQDLNNLAVNMLHDKNNTSLANKESIKDNTIIAAKNAGSMIDDNATEKNIAAENYALQNEEPSQKRTDKVALQVYASPSIIYGISAGPAATSSVTEGVDANNLMNQNIGLEAGTAMQYSLSNILKVKAGLQFNYASYDIAMASSPLAYNDALASAYTQARAADLTNTVSPVTLHNEMYQFSLPVGLELKLLKHNNFQWKAGATIQPTYIAGGNAYLLSSDSHIDESALINRWNLNAGFETFITYKIDGVTWQLGPQFRYQFSSTYGKAYSGVDEKVAIFGVKIGITKTLH